MFKIRETFVNESKGHCIGQSDYYEPFTDDRTELFRGLQKEYGRCVSKVYVDTREESARSVGWVFEKRRQYTDSDETYLQHVWIECVEIPDEEAPDAGPRKYKVIPYIQADPLDQEPLTLSQAQSEKEQFELLNPENLYRIVEIEDGEDE